MAQRGRSSWSTRERSVVGVVIVVTAAVAVSQLDGDRSIGTALTYVGFMLGMVGLGLGAAAVLRAAGPREAASGFGATQKALLAASAVVLVWAAVDAARMDGGFVLAAFLASAVIGLAYVTVVGLGAVAVIRARRRPPSRSGQVDV